MAKQSQLLVQYGNTFLEHYNAEIGKLYNKFNEDLYQHKILVSSEDLFGVRSVNISKQGLMALSCTNSWVVKSFDFNKN